MPTSGSGVGYPVSTITTALTQAQYRQWSGDTTSPWAATGTSIGIQQIVQLVEEEVSDHLATYLQATQVTDEVHRPLVLEKDVLGQSKTRLYNVITNRKRILTDRTITVTWEEWERSECTVTTVAGCAVVLDSLMGKLDLSRCYSSTGGPCITYDVDVLKVSLDYWCGFESLPLQIQRAIALLARYDAKELIAGVSPMMDDLPWGAPQTQRSDLGLFRSFAPPKSYAANEQGISVFGRGFVGIAAERLVAPFRVMEVRQI